MAMTVETAIAGQAHRSRQTPIAGVIAVAALSAFLAAPMAVPVTAVAAETGAAAPTGRAVTFETIPGSSVKRVILSEKAAERLGIETAEVREERVSRKQMFGGTVVHPARVEQVQLAQAETRGAFSGFGQAAPGLAESLIVPDSGETWIRLAVSPAEWQRVAPDRPARILSLGTRDDLPREVMARLSPLPPMVDMKRSMLTVFYVVSGQDQGLRVNDRLRVELELKGHNEVSKVVPYGALYYDDEGKPWVYVRTAPLTFERQRVEVERVDGDTATLKEGPAIGTSVVSVGAPLLYGAEVIYKY